MVCRSTPKPFVKSRAKKEVSQCTKPHLSRKSVGGKFITKTLEEEVITSRELVYKMEVYQYNHTILFLLERLGWEEER